MSVRLLAAALVVCLGCKAKDKPPPTPAERLAAFRADVLPALPGEPSLEARLLSDNTIVAAIPARWMPHEHLRGVFLAPEDDAPFGTRLTITTNCDGMCGAKDWPAVVAAVEFKRYQSAPWRVVRDARLTGVAGRILVASDAGDMEITVARWAGGADRYLVCRARVPGDQPALAQSLERACVAAVPLFLD